MQMVRLLVAAGANVEVTLQQGPLTPLAMAAADGKLEIMQILLGELPWMKVIFCVAWHQQLIQHLASSC
jgi:hypothetical protein